MQAEIIINGGITIVLSPDTEVEIEALKQLMKQSNEIVEIRSAASVLGKTFTNGIIIGKKQAVQEKPAAKPNTPAQDDKA